MGRFEKTDNQWVYKQNDGEITARFIDYKDRKVLFHKGDPLYRKAFYILVALGVIYLGVVFLLV